MLRIALPGYLPVVNLIQSGHKIGAHEPQHLSRIERQPDNPGIAARTT